MPSSRFKSSKKACSRRLPRNGRTRMQAMNPDVAFPIWSGERAQRVAGVLDTVLPPTSEPPNALHEAMRYAVLGGGKRVRALLAYAGGELARVDPADVDAAAAAVELIHGYSLVHDDLPSMDND